MDRTKECILSLAAETAADIPIAEYVSEGLYSAAVALEGGGRRVLSTDILGPTWYPNNATTGPFGIHRVVAAGPAGPEAWREAVAAGRVPSLDDMRARMVDPSWRLTESAAELMTDFTFLEQIPVLNLLNGFEYVMDNVFRSAARLVSETENERAEVQRSRRVPKVASRRFVAVSSPSWRIDANTLSRKKSGIGGSAAAAAATTTADLALARARRAVSLFLGYALVDAIKWKRAICLREKETGIENGSAPGGIDYDNLIALVEKRVADFTAGSESHGISRDGETGVEYVLPSLTHILLNASAVSEDSFFPHISGTFYEAVLGYRIMSSLSGIVDAEYRTLLSATASLPPPPTFGEEERVAGWRPGNPAPEAQPREKHPSEEAFRNHPFLPRAIGGIFGGDGSRVAQRALHREYDRTPLQTGIEERLLNGRQASFSNFSVARTRPASSVPKLIMRVLWNSLFLSTGGVTNSVNGTRSRLLLHFLLKDMHALFACLRCEYGYITKLTETLALADHWSNEAVDSKQPRRQQHQGLVSHLWSAFLALVPAINGLHRTASEGTLANLILNSGAEGIEGEDQLVHRGKEMQAMRDEHVTIMYSRDRKAFGKEVEEYVKVSKGFTALAFYLLYASAASAPSDNAVGINALDSSVTALIGRWSSAERHPPSLLGGRPSSSSQEAAASSHILSFAGIWALRNAVRARRRVGGLPSTEAGHAPEPPGRPLPLLSALGSRRRAALLNTNPYVQAQIIDEGGTLWESLEHLRAESEVWAASSAPISVDALSEVVRGRRSAETSVEPSGPAIAQSAPDSFRALFPRRRGSSAPPGAPTHPTPPPVSGPGHKPKRKRK